MGIDVKLRGEVEGLVRYVERLRQEIANVAQGRDTEKTNFQTMSTQLDAIVVSTEQASNTIMEASEKILEASGRLGQDLSEEERLEAQNQIHARTTEVLEACSFQDLTGQRVTKILNSLRFVEERVEKMIDVCGSDAMMELIGALPEPEQRGGPTLSTSLQPC